MENVVYTFGEESIHGHRIQKHAYVGGLLSGGKTTLCPIDQEAKPCYVCQNAGQTTWDWTGAQTSQSSMYESTLTHSAWTDAGAAASHWVETLGDRERPKESIMN